MTNNKPESENYHLQRTPAMIWHSGSKYILFSHLSHEILQNLFSRSVKPKTIKPLTIEIRGMVYRTSGGNKEVKWPD